MNPQINWFIPNFLYDQMDGTDVLCDENHKLYIFLINNIQYSDEVSKSKIIEKLKTQIDEDINESTELFKSSNYYTALEFDKSEDCYSCFGFKIGINSILKFAASANNEICLQKLKEAIKGLQEIEL